jgi:hypothetical protein
MKSKYAVIMTSLTLAFMLVSTPATFAQVASPEGHSILFIPATQQIPPGGTIIAVVGVQAPLATDIVGTFNFVVQDRLPYGAAVSNNNNLCQGQAINGALGLGPEDIQTLLVDGGQLPALVPVAFEFNGGSGGVLVGHLAIGPIGNANPVVFATPGGNVIPYYLNAGVKTPLVGAPVWVQIIGPNAADGINPVPAGGFGISNNVLLAQNTVASCGCSDFSGDGVCAGPPTEADGVSQESYNIVELVGGALMEISSVSLLVSGAQSSAFWLLPILGLAGTIIAIRKLEA